MRKKVSGATWTWHRRSSECFKPEWIVGICYLSMQRHKSPHKDEQDWKEREMGWQQSMYGTLYRKGQGIPFLYEMQHFHTYLVLAELWLTLKCHSHRLTPFFTNLSPFRSLNVCVCLCVLGVVFILRFGKGSTMCLTCYGRRLEGQNTKCIQYNTLISEL